MNIEVKVPVFAEGATKIKIRQWFVGEGSKVNAGENLVEATTDKIAIYIETPVSGYLKAKLVKEEDEVLVDQVIAIISQEEV
ncbi:MAG: hypothetical protein CVV02_08275 [Firmicutes bacterium HGW-Firmicutes-7]|nr:MAG: hypothetical protein CVV02_08275 [Firmicutes bacterium HGW-Firmicutes-7]